MLLKDYIEKFLKTGFNTAVRLKLSNIPIIGTSADVLYTETIQMMKDIELNRILENLDYTKVDKEYLDSLEFHNFLVKTYGYMINDICSDKAQFFSKLIKNSLESTKEERRYNFDYVKIVSELSIEQMFILKELFNQQKGLFELQKRNSEYNELELVIQHTNWNNFSKIIFDRYGIESEDLKFLLKRIESTGLIHEITGTYMSYEGGIYKINYSLKKLFDKLEILYDD